MNGSASSQVFQSREPPANSTTPEEFIRMTKGITNATAKAVAAGNSGQQEDIISTANLSRKAITDMLTTCKVRDANITTLLVVELVKFQETTIVDLLVWIYVKH